jgi:hypothetical protein
MNNRSASPRNFGITGRRPQSTTRLSAMRRTQSGCPKIGERERQLHPSKPTVRRLNRLSLQCQIRTSRATCRRSIIRRGTASSSSSRARRKSLHPPPLCRTQLGTIVDGRARSLQCLEQVLGERAGRLRGGKPFARCALSDAAEPLYRGEIVHKKQSYPGERSPIIDR